MVIPKFRYHPEPLATGAVEASDGTCDCCKAARGYLYQGSSFSPADGPDPKLCPWCIAEGRAASQVGVRFNRSEEIHGGNTITEDVRKEIVERTPGYATWQDPHPWFACCNDACALVAITSEKNEMAEKWPAALDYFEANGPWTSAEILESFSGDTTAYIFRCLHCRKTYAHADNP